MKELKKLLGENWNNDVEKAIEAEIEARVSKGGANYIPKEKYNALLEESKTLRADIVKRDKQIEDLKPKAAGNDALLKQIEDLQNKNKSTAEEYEKRIAETKRSALLDIELAKHKPVDHRALKAVIDIDAIKYGDNDTIEGLDKQIEDLKSDPVKKHLFIQDSNIPDGTGARQDPGNYAEGDKKEIPSIF